MVDAAGAEGAQDAVFSKKRRRVTLMSRDNKEQRNDQIDEALLIRLKSLVNTDALRKEQLFRRQLKRTVEVLQRTRHAFRSKQLKNLREEIESVLKSN